MVGLQWKKDTLYSKIRWKLSTLQRILLLTGVKKDPVLQVLRAMYWLVQVQNVCKMATSINCILKVFSLQFCPKKWNVCEHKIDKMRVGEKMLSLWLAPMWQLSHPSLKDPALSGCHRALPQLIIAAQDSKWSYYHHHLITVITRLLVRTNPTKGSLEPNNFEIFVDVYFTCERLQLIQTTGCSSSDWILKKKLLPKQAMLRWLNNSVT